MKYRMLLRSTLGMMALAAIATSCSFEQDEYFDETASLRVTHMNEKIQKRLVEQGAEGNQI